ncbi:Deubiquitination-protection protein dph1 [Trametes pubescens]|uniref:Deubiquitination-protection protein dph1 n=1 Tax=Trametes pubescens TaxID=154538 RepID=A0A1M2VDL1_TRAPU|nr:Deubiquitination-protection protein dph1 [Trametes pubescens]
MSDPQPAEASSSEISINVKGPSELKLQIAISTDKTVSELKQAIAEKSDVPADRQRLIYSGRVLKDEDALVTYKIQSGHTIHMVKGAARAGPSAQAAAPQQLPTMQSGQNPHDPLTQLNGPMGFGLMAGFNPFAEMGLNPNDPNMMQTMLNSPQFLQQMSGVMANPAVLDQIIASNPQLAAMGPQVREVFRSERFRQMMSNPETLRMMLQMSSLMRESGGGAPGLGGLGALGGLGGAGAGNGGFPAPGLPSTARQQQPEGAGAGAQPPAGSPPAAGGFPNYFSPFGAPYSYPGAPGGTAAGGSEAPAGGDASAGLGAGAAPGLGGAGMFDPAIMQQMLAAMGGGSGGGAGAAANPFGGLGGFGAGGLGGLGGLGAGGLGGFGAPAAPVNTQPPEERFQVQLQADPYDCPIYTTSHDAPPARPLLRADPLDPQRDWWLESATQDGMIRTRGLLFVRPEKSWRPIVTISVQEEGHDHGLPHEIVLGSDGQNPNLKSAIQIRDVKPSTRLVFQVYHKSQTKKKHRKRTLVGSANLSLNEFLNRHPLPHHRPVEYDVRLSCPPPQRKSPTIGGKQQHSAALTLKFAVPFPSHVATSSRPGSPLSDEHLDTDGMFSDGASSSKGLISAMTEEPASERPWEQPSNPDTLGEQTGLRRRRRRTRGFHVDSASEDGMYESSEDEPWMPPTPPDDYFDGVFDGGSEDACGSTLLGAGEEAICSPCILPMHGGDQESVYSMERSLSFAESVVDSFGPYRDLCEADAESDVEKAEKVLGRLLTEWYVVGASLLALAGIDAAVFGFASDATFIVDGFARSVVAIGAIAAGIGLVSDAWFLVLYSGANAVKFQVSRRIPSSRQRAHRPSPAQRLAKDVYGSYFFFCLTCRLPTMCMFLSTLALMLFLLGVAWTAWPTAVLVMSFVAGVLLSSQFLVFGIHRAVNFVVWVVRVTWRKIAGARQLAKEQPGTSLSQPQHQAPHASQPQPQPTSQLRLPAARPAHATEAHDGIQMPVPEPAPAA